MEGGDGEGVGVGTGSVGLARGWSGKFGAVEVKTHTAWW